MAAQKQIFPHEIVEFSVEKHFNDYGTRTKQLYLTILGIVLLTFILLFIIKVDVTVTSAGSISPILGRSTIRTPINGIVDSLFVTENQHVVAGQPLVKVHAQSLDEKGIDTKSQQEELKGQVSDLQMILGSDPDNFTDLPLKSSLYKQQYSFYKQKLADVQNKFNLASKSFSRYKSLYKSRVISAEEYDKYNYNLRDVESERRLVTSQQFTQWQSDLTKLTQELQGVSSTIKAPIEGYIQQLKGIQPGSIITPSDILGQISPDTGMIAEAFVLPKDIGLIRPGAPIRIQVDAYNYNVWGMLKGDVLSVSNDIFTDANQPYFKVRCRLNSQSLKLKNGYKGYVKNGMTVQAHFVVTRRSLMQLLYDKADDWLNPNQLVIDENNKKANG